LLQSLALLAALAANAVLSAYPDPPRATGRPTVVVVFASWCAACLQELPRDVDDYRRFHSEAEFLGIDYDDNPRGLDLVKKGYGIPFPIHTLQGKQMTLPSVLVLDANGDVAAAHAGYDPHNDAIASALRKLGVSK
jgi:thiol-disulfide isomerase/thioredoxin